MRKLFFAGALFLTYSSAIGQTTKWVLWYQPTPVGDDGKTLFADWQPVAETNTLLDCNNAIESHLAAEGKSRDAKRVGDAVAVKVEGAKVWILKRFYCYMYGHDPRFKR
jgi:hypothetical protein